MNVLVTGGAGYIGSHAVKLLVNAGHQVTVLDNLSKGYRAAIHPKARFVEGDTGDAPLLRQLFRESRIEAVLHFAADIEVGESVTNPAKYYRNNFSNTLNLLMTMVEAGVLRIVFSSTAAVYGNPSRTPVDESAERLPINPYGRSKFMTEMAIEDFRAAHGLSYAILRYFNVAGASPEGEIGEDHQPESHLIPRILASARDGGETSVKIFGTDYPTPDGTCIRDYVHVVDLVEAHLLAMERLEGGRSFVYNVGSESGFSVREVVRACEKVTGLTLKVEEQAPRPGDPPVLVASGAKIRSELGWKPRYPALETMLEHAWKWHRSHPQGYRG